MKRDIEFIGFLEGKTYDQRVAELLIDTEGLTPEDAHLKIEHEIWDRVNPDIDDMPAIRRAINLGRSGIAGEAIFRQELNDV